MRINIILYVNADLEIIVTDLNSLYTIQAKEF